MGGERGGDGDGGSVGGGGIEGGGGAQGGGCAGGVGGLVWNRTLACLGQVGQISPTPSLFKIDRHTIESIASPAPWL